MKKISHSRMCIEYILIILGVYLIISLIISLIWGISYRSVLTHPSHLIATLFIYWWLPMFRMCDIDEYNKSLKDDNNM